MKKLSLTLIQMLFVFSTLSFVPLVMVRETDQDAFVLRIVAISQK